MQEEKRSKRRATLRPNDDALSSLSPVVQVETSKLQFHGSTFPPAQKVQTHGKCHLRIPDERVASSDRIRA